MRVVIGTNKADRICIEGRGHHVIYGRGGDDVIWDAAASDVIHGGAGNDTVYANGGQDTVFGGDGADAIYGGAGDDTIMGLAGNDQLLGSDGNDVVSGGDGADGVDGGSGADTMSGDAGDDFATGDSGADTVDGGDGRDQIFGGDDSDQLTGGAGDDHVDGEFGDDTLNGGEGADIIDGGSGADTVSGDAGDDLAVGGSGADTVDGGDGSDHVLGGDDSDQLTGGAGDDHVNGGLGDDNLSGGPGTNTCDGGGGNDHLDLTCDSSKPQLRWMSFSQSSVDSSQGDVQVTVTARFTDDLSGFENAAVAPSDASLSVVDAQFNPANRISGDAFDGIYQATFTVRQYTPTDTWPLAVYARDVVGNWGWTTTTQLQALDVPWQFSQTGPGDDTAPTASTVTLASTSLDSSSGPASIDATVHVDDDLSGFGSLFIILNGPAGQRSSVYIDHSGRTSGTALSGDYAGSVDLPRYSASGAWQVAGGTIVDLAGNRRDFSTSEAVALMGGVDVITETGLGDDTGPVADSLSFTPDGADPATSDVQVTLTMHATDDLSGFHHADCLASSPNLVIHRDAYVGWASRISGDTMDGNYQLTFSIPQYSQRGLWTATCTLYDFVGNHTTTSPAVIQIG
jgi:hypothetical protein